MPTPRYSVTCLQNTLIAKDIYDIRFAKPEGFNFKAGQFILFDVPLLTNPSDIQTRAYSIASSPEEEELIFIIKLKEGGRASIWIEESLKAGDTVSMQGPFGVFTLPGNVEKDVLMICTSTGIAPFRSQIPELLSRGFSQSIDLIYGARNEEDLFWVEYFEELERTHPNFKVHVTLSQPSPSWTGHTGRVQTVLPTIEHLTERNVYVCGSPVMTADIKKLCLEQYGIERSQFHMEGYI